MFGLDIVHPAEGGEGRVIIAKAVIELTEEMVSPRDLDLSRHLGQFHQALGKALRAAMIESADEMKHFGSYAARFRFANQLGELVRAIGQLERDRKSEIPERVRGVDPDNLAIEGLGLRGIEQKELMARERQQQLDI